MIGSPKKYERKDAVKVSFYKGSGPTEFSHVTLTTFDKDGVTVDFLPDTPASGSTSIAVGFSSTKRTSVGVPDVCLYLYGLDIDKIQSTWLSIKDKVRWYAASGKEFSSSRDDEIYINSAGLCLGLLCVGGFLNFHGKNFVDSRLKAFCDTFLSLGVGIVHTTVSIGAGAIPAALAIGMVVASVRGNGSPADKVAAVTQAGAVIGPLANIALSEAGKALGSYSEVGISFSHVVGIITPTKLEETVLAAHKHQQSLIVNNSITIDSVSTADFRIILPTEESGCTIM